MSITFTACPEKPYELGVLVDSWELKVCEKIDSSDKIIKQEGNDYSSFKDTKRICKGKW